MRDRGWLLAIFLTALTLRLVHAALLAGTPFAELRFGDGVAYHEWAQRIAKGDWLGSEVFYQAPFYPYFLAVVYTFARESMGVIRTLHALLGAASCLILAVAGRSLFGRGGMLAGALLAVYPPAIFQEALLEKTAWIGLFTTSLLALLINEGPPTWRRWAGAGVLIGLLAITRENALLLLLPCLVWIYQKQRWRAAAVFLAGCAAILLPVALRNLAVGGEFHLTTAQFGPNFYIGNHSGATGIYEPLVPGHGSAMFERSDATNLAQQALDRLLTPGEVSSFWTSQALHYITSQPGDWIKLMARKLALTFHAREAADTESQIVHAEWSPLVAFSFAFGWLLALAVAGVALTWRSRQKLWLLCAIILLYGLSTALFFVFARYRFPLVPPLALLATGGMLQGATIWRNGPRKQLTAPALAAALTLVLTHIPLLNPSDERAVNYIAIAAALSSDPAQFATSRSFYDRALAEDPHWPPALYGLGLLLTQSGRSAEAIPHLQHALRIWPDYAEAQQCLRLAMATAQPR